MRYIILFQVNGEDFSDMVDADDAATAVQRIQEIHQSSSVFFELLSVQTATEVDEFEPMVDSMREPDATSI